MTKEKVYDAKIAPLMNDIIKICQDYGIAMIANFSIPDAENPDLGCCTMIPDQDRKHPSGHITAQKAILPKQDAPFMAFMITRAVP